MSSKNKKKPDPQKQSQLPTTGEGSGSALDVLKKKRGQQPSEPPLPPDPATR